MAAIKDRLFKLLQDPRVGKLMRDPRVQQAVVQAFRFRGRIESEYNARVQRIAGMLHLATQRDLRALQRRIRHLEQELRQAEERLTAAEADREARGRS